MQTVDRACRTAQLLSGELPRIVDHSAVSGVGLDRAEFDALVTHELARLLDAHPCLSLAATKAKSAPDDQKAWSSVRSEMEKTLRKDTAKLDALWSLLEAAGQLPHTVEESDDESPPRRRGHLRRWAAATVTTMGAALAVVMMLALAGLAILGSEVSMGSMLLRWFAVVVLSCLPGWMFLRFIIFRAGSLWTEYVLNLHRLGMDDHAHLPPPPMSSGYYHLWSEGGGSVLAGSPNVYQQKFEAYYGKFVGTHDSDRRKPALDKTIPQVLLATAVLAVGWTAVLARPKLFSAPLVLPADTLRFAFMGAYVFILQMLIRRFFQSDLKASAYLGAVARIVTVLIVVLVVHEALPVANNSVPPGTEVGLAFLIGFFPLLGMQVLQKLVSLAFRKFIPTLKTPYPLSDLDGLNIWYEARLLEEGIEDMQNLVTGNLVDIILHTRVPVGRLVDWLDQAALQLLVDSPGEKDKKRPTCDRRKLRRIGIRTATDMETAFLPPDVLACHASRAAVCSVNDSDLIDGLRQVLNDKELPGVNVTEALLKTFCNIPNLVHVRHWRDILCTEHEAIHGVNTETQGVLVTNGSHPG